MKLSPETETAIRKINEKTDKRLQEIRDLKQRVLNGDASDQETQEFERMQKCARQKMVAKAELNNSEDGGENEELENDNSRVSGGSGDDGHSIDSSA